MDGRTNGRGRCTISSYTPDLTAINTAPNSAGRRRANGKFLVVVWAHMADLAAALQASKFGSRFARSAGPVVAAANGRNR